MSVEIESMVGVTMTSVTGEIGGEEMIFEAKNGRKWRFYHEQDYYEDVSIEDICGDLSDLVDSPITMAEDVRSAASVPDTNCDPTDYRWTFYKFATEKGFVTVRWFGDSQHYSTYVDLEVIEANADEHVRGET